MFDFFPAFFVCQEKRKKETERLNHKDTKRKVSQETEANRRRREENNSL